MVGLSNFCDECCQVYKLAVHIFIYVQYAPSVCMYNNYVYEICKWKYHKYYYNSYIPYLVINLVIPNHIISRHISPIYVDIVCRTSHD